MASLDFAQLQTIINNATKSDAKTKELRRVINRATAALENLSIIFGDIITILGDDYEASATTRSPRAKREKGPVDESAPYGRKANGEPKAKPGRGVSKADGTGELALDAEVTKERKPYKITVDGAFRLYSGKYTSNAKDSQIKIYTGDPENMKAKLMKSEGITEESFNVIYV